MKIIYILIAIVSFISLVSCSKWLDVRPKQQLERDDFYSSDRGFKSSLNGCYLKLKNTYSVEMMMTTVEYLGQQWEDRDKEYLKELKDFDYESDYVKERMQSIYGNIYNIIVQANDLLTYLEKKGDVIGDADVRNVIKGEALAIRAFCHFDIVRLFGKVPKGTKDIALPYSETFSNQNPQYYGFNEYIEKVLKDFSDAEKLLKESDPILKYSFGRLSNSASIGGIIKDDIFLYRNIKLNYYAVKSLMARVYLYKGDYDNAYKYANSVIEAKIDNVDEEENHGKQVIELSSKEDFNNNLYTAPNETLMSLDVYDILKKTENFFRISPEAENNNLLLYATNDHDEIIGMFNSNFDVRLTKIWYLHNSANGLSYSSIKKYWQKDNSLSPDSDNSTMGKDNVVPIIRLSEVYLIAIEAVSYSDLARANTLLDSYQRSKNSTLQTFVSVEELNDEIFREYFRDFYAEGQMFFAYKRLNKTTMFWRNNPVKEDDYIIPLPNTEY